MRYIKQTIPLLTNARKPWERVSERDGHKILTMTPLMAVTAAAGPQHRTHLITRTTHYNPTHHNTLTEHNLLPHIHACMHLTPVSEIFIVISLVFDGLGKRPPTADMKTRHFIQKGKKNTFFDSSIEGKQRENVTLLECLFKCCLILW